MGDLGYTKPKEKTKSIAKFTTKQLKFIEFHGHINPETGEYNTDTQCAKLANYSNWRAGGAILMMKPHIRKAVEDRMKRILDKTEKAAIEHANARNFDVMERAIELANLDPSKTKNTISGQVRACQLIAEMQGLIVNRNADVTEELWQKESRGKSLKEKEYFAIHGKWPEAKSVDNPSVETEGSGGNTIQ